MSLTSYLIAFRDDDGTRGENLAYVLRYMADLPRAEFIIVEQDAAPRPKPQWPQRRCRILFAPNAGAFNKSWGLNIAALAARGDVLVAADADMLMQVAALQRGIELCRAHCEAVNPYDSLVDLDRDQTADLRIGALALGETLSGASRGRSAVGERLCFCGGMFVIRRETYLRLGGMDERFLGWGGEDDAMSIKLARLLGDLGRHRRAPAWHLWHRRHRERYRHAHYQDNIALLQSYQRLDDASLQALCALHRETMGDPGKYDT